VKTKIAQTVDDLIPIAKAILADAKNDRIFAFEAKMGAGKTTLIKAFCKVLGVEETVSSPTFSIVNEYEATDFHSIFHFDFYRLNKVVEVFDIGYEEYFYSDEYCFIEWPAMVLELLPESYVYVSIEVNDKDERLISWKTIQN